MLIKRFTRFTALLIFCFIPKAFSQHPPAPHSLGDGGALVKDGETIAFLGDSITAGGGSYGGYCRLVIHGLKTKGIRAKAIYAGVPGNKSSDMLLRLDSILAQKPDHLFLSVGVNDVWHTDPTAKIGVYKPSPGMGCELEYYKIYVPQILDRCKVAGTNVIMSTFTQITENPEHRLNKKAEAYNAFLRELAKERNLPIALLNEAAWEKINELKAKGNTGLNMISSDGIHPTAIGHRVMALGILKTMGLTDGELKAVEKEWNECPLLLTMGDRQVYSGTRDCGWRVMLLDCLNSGREMVLDRSIVEKPATIHGLLPKVKEAIDKRSKYLLFVAPMGEILKKTPIAEYEADVRSLIELAKSKGLQLVISTYGIVDTDPKSEVNVSAGPYNDVLRNVCKETSVPLVDIAQIMLDYLQNNPGSQLTFGDERFNHIGGKLMAEAVFKAFGGDEAVLPELRKIWDESSSYTFKYEKGFWTTINLSTEGIKALGEVSERYHKLEPRKILAVGIHHLLNDETSVTLSRLAFAETNWLAKMPVENPIKLRTHPNSENQRRAIQSYIDKNGIGWPAFYRQAFDVGLYITYMTDVLGRGAIQK